MRGFRFLPALVTVLALILAACGGTTASSSEPSQTEGTTVSATESPSESAAESEAAEPSESTAAEETVRLSQFAFDPEELTIAVGTEVKFVNADSAAHTVTEGTDGTAVADPIIDEELPQGGSTSYTFDEPGTYDITCKIHPSMQLTITVEP
jgi:plastocyanin